nr:MULTISPECIES: hypothetical protein [Providencia]
MQSPPDLLTPLSEIIGYSETELQSQSKWYLACKITLERSVIRGLLMFGNDSYAPAFLILGIACAVLGWGVIEGLIYICNWMF